MGGGWEETEEERSRPSKAAWASGACWRQAVIRISRVASRLGRVENIDWWSKKDKGKRVDKMFRARRGIVERDEEAGRETNGGSVILDDLDGVGDDEGGHFGSDGDDFGEGEMKLS
jgi:hypothetical protein